MKLSSQWIREFVDLTVDDRRLAEDLTGVGIAVEGISGSGADTVFEMEIGTNRPDAMNHYGVAREAAAIYDLPLKQLSALSSSAVSKPSNEPAFPTHGREEPQLCPRFSARVDTRNEDQGFARRRLRTACDCSISGRSAMRSMLPIMSCGRWASLRMSSTWICSRAGG